MYQGTDFVLDEGAEEKVLQWQQWGQKYRYENEEEYLAVVITNIYLSEKWGGTDWLRSGHDNPRKLTDPDEFLDNSEGIDYPPRALIQA